MRCVFLLILFLSAICAWGCGSDPVSNQPPTTAAILKDLLKQAEIRQDPDLAKSMTPKNMPLPAAFSKMFAGEKVVAMKIINGFTHGNGHPALFWRVTSGLVAGNPAKIKDRIGKRLLAMGFKQFKPIRFGTEVSFRRESSSSTESLLGRFTKGFDSIGPKLIWNLRFEKKTPVPTYEELITAMPSFQLTSKGNPPIPKTIMNFVKAQPVTYATLGANDARYQWLDLTIPAIGRSTKELAEVTEEIAALAGKKGFTRLKPTHPDEANKIRLGVGDPAKTTLEIRPGASELKVRFSVQLR